MLWLNISESPYHAHCQSPGLSGQEWIYNLTLHLLGGLQITTIYLPEVRLVRVRG